MSAKVVRREWFLAVGLSTAAMVFFVHAPILSAAAGPVGMAVLFVALFVVIAGSSLSVVRHADCLAERLGEPYGTLILTLSVGVIEVASVSAVILGSNDSPTLVRDSLLSVVMIILNGMVGLALLIGGWRHREQHYNLQGANTYLGLIIPLVVLSLVLPSFTRTTPGPTLSWAQSAFLILTSVGLYIAFVAIQTGRHRDYFTGSERNGAASARDDHQVAAAGNPIPFHAVLLVSYMLPVVLLAEQLARPINYFVESLHAPLALGGLALAALVALPEATGAVHAAFGNHLQRAVNIFLGSVLATICLTVPAMLVISHLAGRNMILAVEGTDRVMLLLTLTVSIVTFSSGRTNVLQGAVHLLLFVAYLLLMFQG